MSDSTDLELSGAAFEDLVRRAAAMCARAIDGLPDVHAAGRIGAEAAAEAAALRTDFSDEPAEGGFDALVPVLERAFDLALVTSGPGYLAYVPGGGLPVAAVADLVAGVMNRYAGLAEAAPGPCALEDAVVRFLAREIGYGEGAAGVLLSGGSLANFTALVAAREACLPDGADLRRAMVYASDQAHHSVAKSVRLAGIPAENVRAIGVDARLRMDPSALETAMAEDVRAGRIPMCVVTSAGTTNTGAIDPFEAVAAVARAHGAWHHVDGAYGGAFALCGPGKARLRGMELADSITVDPHKGLFLPYGTGCLLVRDRETLVRAFRMGASYLQDFADTPELIASPAHLGPELSRPFRGLRLWLAFRLHGVAAFRRALEEKLALAERLAERLADLAAQGVPVELVERPQLSVVAFRLAPGRDQSLADANAENAAFLREIVRPGRVFVSSTMLPSPEGPRFTVRACVLSFRTHRAQIDAAIEDVAAAARAVRGPTPAGSGVVV